MSNTTWADIQRLAADLQRVQLAESSKRLTEVNCVQVVSMLMSMGLVDLVVSSDGKEYITRKHLQTECANECLAAGGRIALTELTGQLNVDLDHVNAAVAQLLQKRQQQGEDEEMEEEDGEGRETNKTAAEFVVCAGELLHRDFINGLCARLDARLQELGSLSMLQLTRQWELPTELLNQHILPTLGTHPDARISAIRFDDQLCTVRYICALRSKMRALLIALTKPTLLANIHAHMGISHSLFFKLWNELVEMGMLPGKLLGSKNSLKSLYVPGLYERLAKQYTRQRLTEDRFLETSILRRLSIIGDPAAYFRELLPPKEYQDLIFWPSVTLSESSLWRECDSLARNLLQTNHFCLLEDILPTQFTFLTDDDYARVVERLQQHCNGSNLCATGDRSAVYEHPQLLQTWLKRVDGFVREKATKDAPELRKAQLTAALAAKQKQQKTNTMAVQKEDSWEIEKPGKKGKGFGKKGSAVANTATGQTTSSRRQGKQKGGGTQQQEQQQQSAQDPLTAAHIPTDELLTELKRQLPSGFEIPPTIWDELVDDFGAEARRIYQAAVAEAWQQQTEEMADGGESQQEIRRKAYEQKMAKIGHAYGTICMYEKGAEAFEDPLGADLRSYLLRTLCTELANSYLFALTDPSAVPPSTISAKLREQLIGDLESAQIQKRVVQLFDSLDCMEKFHESAQQLGAMTSLVLKQPDKKDSSERLVVLKMELRAQLANCTDPPSLLLLAVLLSLNYYHGLAVHASGKFVSPLIVFLAQKKPQSDHQPAFPSDLAVLLNETQRLVVMSIKQQKGEQQDEQLRTELAEKVAKIRTHFRENAEEEKEEEGMEATN